MATAAALIFQTQINLPYLTNQNHNWKDVKQNSTLFACLLFAAQSPSLQKNFFERVLLAAGAAVPSCQ